jgi:hypothetical protein
LKPNGSKTAIFNAGDLQTNILTADNSDTGTHRPGNMDDSGKDEMYHFLKDKLASRHVSPDIVLDNQEILHEMDQEMWHEMDSLKEQMKAVDKAQEWSKRITIGAAAGLVTVISAGYFIWAARGGPLLTGLLSSAPIWQFFDPQPLLDLEKEKIARISKLRR